MEDILITRLDFTLHSQVLAQKQSNSSFVLNFIAVSMALFLFAVLLLVLQWNGGCLTSLPRFNGALQ